MINREVFARDPLKNSIPNDGVAKIVEPESPGDWDVLRYELSTFVCEGEYQRGLETILDTYLRNLDRPTQPAAWVSGFYGSGKSHLVRVLEFLWRDVTFPDGATARSLVDLPLGIEEHLRELTTAGRQAGGLWSAAGTLGAGAGESVRLAILGIVLRSAGLPGHYAQGRFVLWLRQSGFYNAVKSFIEAEGRDFRRELQNLYVSPYVARGLLSAYPEFAGSEADARALIKAQYGSPQDVSDEEMLDVMEGVLALQSTDPDKMPCTLLVLDELQQYIGDNADRTLRVQNVVEACSSHFEGSLLFVATGQSALQGGHQLSKLQGRFNVRVALSDTDVDKVVRQVVLRKAPDKVAGLRSVLDTNSGEIDRQLAGTKIAPVSADREVLVPDYPLLPSRRRFWERVLRAIDRAGAAGQLRTQLRIVQEAVEDVANREVGTVVPADFVYDQLSPAMLQTGVLLKEVDETIRGQRDGTEDGELRSRMCALVFLIGQLPTDAGSDTGLRATAQMLADLLVEDLRVGGSALRGRIPQLLDGMVESGKLMLVDGEYRLQTREGAEWTQAYHIAYARIFGDDGRIASDRSRELREAVGEALKNLSYRHGESKTPRKAELNFGAEMPRADTGNVPVWVRDEWSVTERTAREEAQAAGAESPVVHIFLPRRSADDLKKAIASYEAATEVISGRPAPTTHEGQEARAAMEFRRRGARATLEATVDAVLRNARVMQGGGNEVTGASLRDMVTEAGWASLDRMYPRFGEGDNARWHLVVKRAREGGEDALSALGYSGEPDKHPVCREVLTFIGPGKKGREVRANFDAPPYGWSRDAVDGALLTLVAAGLLRVAINGIPATAREIDQGKIGAAEFRAETRRIGIKERIEVRKLLTAAGVQWRSNEEALAAPLFVNAMLGLAEKAGGEPPLPERPATRHLLDLQAAAGNELLISIFDARDRLQAELEDWRDRAEKARLRLPAWSRLRRLLDHAPDLPEAADLQRQADAVERDRALLADPDPVPPLLAGAADVLRAAVAAAHERYARAFDASSRGLESSEDWQALGAADRDGILRLVNLTRRGEPRLDSPAAILDALDATSLSEWDDRTAALPERFTQALQEAARKLEPQAVRVRPPGASLKTEKDVDEYLKALRSRILGHISEGRPVIL